MCVLCITQQWRLDSPTSVQNGAVQLPCNIVDGTFSVRRLPFVQVNLFHTVNFNFYTKREWQSC